jgi:hypothetical protein
MTDIADAEEAVRYAAQLLSEAAGKPQAPALARAYFAAWVNLLKFHHPISWNSKSTQLPPDLAAMLTGLFGYLAVGQIPRPIADAAAGSGRRGIGPTERKDIQTAVDYVEAAKRGNILDRSPVKTICEHYGVGRSTVQGWKRSFNAAPQSSDTLRNRMIEAGKGYQAAGRSHSAIRTRG